MCFEKEWEGLEAQGYKLQGYIHLKIVSTLGDFACDPHMQRLKGEIETRHAHDPSHEHMYSQRNAHIYTVVGATFSKTPVFLRKRLKQQQQRRWHQKLSPQLDP